MRCMMYEITVFVNLRFRRLIRKQEASGFKKKLHSKDRFRKPAFLAKNAQHVWTQGLNLLLFTIRVAFAIVVS